MSDNQPWTIRRLLEWTTDFFKRSGTEFPRLDSEILLAAALDCPRIQLYTRFDEVPAEPHLGRFRLWVRRHAAGEPVAYLVGNREFFSLKFAVNSAVLIPRPETEHVVLAALECAKQFSAETVLHIADVGTGSGCIAVTLAKHLPNCRIWATDVSADALEVARDNATSHGVAQRIELIECDLLTGVAPDQHFHIIASNPPYVGTEEVGTLAAAVEKYEPAIALFAGANGTEVTALLIRHSVERLLPGGFLVFETSPIVAAASLKLVQGEPALEQYRMIKDFAGHQRVIVARNRR